MLPEIPPPNSNRIPDGTVPGFLAAVTAAAFREWPPAKGIALALFTVQSAF
jgi:hypothetical protein